MVRTRSPIRGYTLIEMVVVLAILGILALAFASQQVGSRNLNAVISVTNQVEATLYAAQRVTTTSLSMVEMTASGNWASKNYALTYTGAAPSDVFRFSANQPDFRRAGVDPTPDAWPSGLGAKPALTGTDGAGILAALDKPLQGLTGGKVTITATRKEFSSPCFIAIVPMDTAGAPLYSGPAGLVVVQGHLIYKYIRSESGQPWRRA